MPALGSVGLGLLSVLGSALVLNDSSAFPGYLAAMPTIATALVIVGGSVNPRGGAEELLRLAPFQLLGKWSYSIYLWHWPLLVIPAQATGNAPTVMQTLSLIALAIVLAAATFYAVENPIRNAVWLKEHVVQSLSLAPTLIVTGLVICTVLMEGHRPPPAVAASDVPVANPAPAP